MIVLGAIALAVVVFGIVVTVGGLGVGSPIATSADTGEATVVAAELDRGIGCLLENANGEGDGEGELESAVDDDLEAFADRYRDARARSTATVVDVELERVALERADGEHRVESATVRVTSESTDRRVERTRTIEAGCPEGEP